MRKIIAALAVSLAVAAPVATATAAQAQTTGSACVTDAEYKKFSAENRDGATIKQVVSLIGSAGEITTDSTFKQRRVWDGCEGSEIGHFTVAFAKKKADQPFRLKNWGVAFCGSTADMMYGYCS